MDTTLNDYILDNFAEEYNHCVQAILFAHNKNNIYGGWYDIDFILPGTFERVTKTFNLKPSTKKPLVNDRRYITRFVFQEEDHQ